MTGTRQSKRVLLVGAGTAGSALLYLLTQHIRDEELESVELDVCEVRQEPWKHVVCGELVPDPEFLQRFVPREVATLLKESHRIILSNTRVVNHFRRLVLIVKNRELEYRFSAFLIDKSELIKNMIEKGLGAVRDMRVKLVQEWAVCNSHVKVLFEDGEARQYDIVICADGFPSVFYTDNHLDFLASRNYLRLACVSFRAEARNFEKDAMYILVDPRLSPGGYAWVFPRGDGVANCGLGVLPRYLSHIRTFVEKLCEKLSLRIRSQVCSKTLPLDGVIKPLTHLDKLVYIGDAAGLVIPTCGAGINTAIISALLLVKSKLNPSAYTRHIRPLAKYIDYLARVRKPLDVVLQDAEVFRRLERVAKSRFALDLAYLMMLGSTRLRDKALYSLLRLARLLYLR